MGFEALFSNSTGANNTADGGFALASNTIGFDNTAVGSAALENTNAEGNTAVGSRALTANTTGNANTAVGLEALKANTDGLGNTAFGFDALSDNTTGVLNTAIGGASLPGNITGNNNIALGWNAGGNVSTANNVICVGAGVTGQNVNDACYIGNIWNETGGAQAVYVNSDGKLGAQVSSRRFKDEIKPMEGASEVIFKLKPVRFRYKPAIEPTRPLGFGLIAEDVEEISPDLVTRDREGKAYTVRYDQVNAMLLNEFLKEHRKVENQQANIIELKSKVAQQQATLARQQKQIATLTSSVQTLRVRLETGKTALRMVLSNP